MSKNEIRELLDQLFNQARMQFGSAIKSSWLHDGDGCPGCGGEISGMKYKGQNTLSLNAFIFREHGVLIAYLLCGKCAKYILDQSKQNPYSQTELHTEIEKNLKKSLPKAFGTLRPLLSHAAGPARRPKRVNISRPFRAVAYRTVL